MHLEANPPTPDNHTFCEPSTLDTMSDVTDTQPQPDFLQTVTCEDGSVYLMSQEQIKSWNISTLQQAARITRWDETTGQFVFAPQPAHNLNNMSLQDALAAAKQALQRCESASAAIYSNDSVADSSSSCPASQPFLPNDPRPEGRPLPSPPPSYTSVSRNRDSPQYIPPENELTSLKANSSIMGFLIVPVLVLIAIWICGGLLTQEPATHERLGRLLMEVVCKDMSVRWCMERVKDGRIGQVM